MYGHFTDRPEFGIGVALVFLPPMVCLLLFGNSWGMVEALQMGVNITFVLLAIGSMVFALYLAYKVVQALTNDQL